MKVCPLCGSRYSARVDFCFHDGAVLASAAAPVVVADAALDPPEPDGLSLPEPRRTATPVPARRAGPVPLTPIQVPLDESGEPSDGDPEQAAPGDRKVPSALVVPPPPQRERPAAPAAAAGATGSAASAPPPSAAASAPQPDDLDDDEPADGRGVPVWVWGALVAVVLIVVGGSAFAVGGMSFVAAMVRFASGAPDPEPEVAVEPLEFPDEPSPEELADAERPKLKLGVQREGDTDEPTADEGPGSAALSPGGEVEEAGAEVVVPADPTATDALGDGTAVDDPPPPEALPEPKPEPVATSRPVSAPPESGPKPAPVPSRPAPAPASTTASSPAPVAAAEATTDSPWGEIEQPPGTVEVTISVQDALAGTIVAVDNKMLVGSPPIKVFLTPGKHAFRITGPSGTSYTLSREVKAGADGSFSLTFPRVE